MKETKAIIFILMTFLLIPILISCESEIKEDSNLIKVDVDSAKKGKISDHFESIEYILLDYPDSLPIVGPYKMILTKDKILVESRETAAVFIFDRKGNLQNVIRDYGDGPGQFRLIDDMFLEGDRLRIHSTYLKKYLIFSLEGKLIEEGKMNVIADRSFIGKEFSLFQIQNGHGPERYTIIRKGNDNEILGFLPLSKDLENFNSYNSIHGFQYDPYRDSFYLTSFLTYEIAVLDGNGFFKHKLDFDFGKNNFDSKKWNELPKDPRGVNRWISENMIVQSVNSFFPFKNKILVKFNEGIKIPHFLFLDNNFNIIYHVNELENDLDGMKIPMWPWAYSENEVIYYLDSKRFQDNYLETFNKKRITHKSGNIHEFFRINKEKLKEEKHVLVVMKVKE